MELKNFATIHCDASYCNKTKLAAWAFRAKSDFGVIKKSGVARNVDGCNAAEMLAVYNAVKEVSQTWEVSGVFINTDSQSTINMLLPEEVVKTSHYKEPQALATKDKIFHLINKNELSFEIDHVKGHQESEKDLRVIELEKEKYISEKRRAYLNNWCDKLAKKTLKKERRKIAAEAA